MINNSRGSEWRKWDLHFHTPSSYDYKNKSISNQEIIDTLIANNISVIAITDHHLIDVERIKELQELGKGKITVLPGIEFRAELGGSESIHYIGIFPENSDLDHIWIKIQSKCEITAKDIEDKGGDAKIYCDLKDTCDLIHKLGGLVTVHAGSKSNSVENITNSLSYKMAQKTELVSNFIDIYELGQEEDQEGYRNIVFPSIGKTVPMIICSDNHNIKNYELKQNLWIKAEPTFEGLKQIIYEPVQRVAIQKNKPFYKPPIEYISEVKFISSQKNKFKTEPILLNQDLNVIIGGKSSGKSLLLYNIANTIDSVQTQNRLSKGIKDDLEIDKIKLNDKYELRKSDNNYNFEVKYANGDIMLLHSENQQQRISNILYIPQNYLHQLSEPDGKKTRRELVNVIINLLRENPESDKAYENFKNRKLHLREIIENNISNYFKKYSTLKDKKQKKENLGNEESTRKFIAQLRSHVEELTQSSNLSSDQVKKYDSLSNELTTLEGELENFLSEKEKIYYFIDSVSRDFKDLSNEIESINNSTVNTILKKQLENTFIDFYGLNAKVVNLLENINYTYQENGKNNSNSILKEEKRLRSAIKNKKEELKPFLAGEKVKNEIEELSNKIKTQNNKLNQITIVKKEIEEIEDQLKNLQTNIFNEYENIILEYENITNLLNQRGDKLEDENLKFEGSFKFYNSVFTEEIKNFVNKSKFTSKEWDNYYCFNRKNDAEFDKEKHIHSLQLFFNNVINGKIPLRGDYNKKNIINSLLREKFFDYWEVYYRKDEIGKMSAGKAGLVLLKLIIELSESQYPILIDQPEDNLDNRSITNELVEYLKEKKLKRQIIIVTHNPNIVVNADAENVIVANQAGQEENRENKDFQFDYITGAIENTFPLIPKDKQPNILYRMGIREHITDVIEGGEDAFKKREEKYGFKNKT